MDIENESFDLHKQSFVDQLTYSDMLALRRLFEHQYAIQWDYENRTGSPSFARSDDDGYQDRGTARAWTGYQLAFAAARAFADRHAESQEEIVTTDLDKITKLMRYGSYMEAAQRAIAVFGKLQIGNNRNLLVSIGELTQYIKQHGCRLPFPRSMRGDPQVSTRATAH